MKIAAGCFGCLALFLLFTYLSLSFGAAQITTMLSEADPTLGTTFAGLLAPIQWVNSGCCCLSGVACIALFAIGSMGNKDTVE